MEHHVAHYLAHAQEEVGLIREPPLVRETL